MTGRVVVVLVVSMVVSMMVSCVFAFPGPHVVAVLPLGDGSETGMFSRVRDSGSGSVEATVLMTESAIYGFPVDGLRNATRFAMPKSLSSDVALLFPTQVAQKLLLVPRSAADTLVVTNCASPSGAQSPRCSLAVKQTVTLTGVPSDTTWKDINAIFLSTGNVAVFVASDELLVTVSCTTDGVCSWEKTYAWSTLLNTTASVFPETVSLETWPHLTNGRSLWLSRSTASGVTSVIVELDVGYSGGVSMGSVTNVAGPGSGMLAMNPDIIVFHSLSNHGQNITTMAFGVGTGSVLGTATIPASEGSIVGAALGPSSATLNEINVFSFINNPNEDGALVNYANVALGATSPPAVLPGFLVPPGAPATQASVGGAVHLWAGVKSASDGTNHVALLVQPQTSASPRASPRASTAPVRVSGATPCVDTSMGATCWKACDGETKSVCGPGVEPQPISPSPGPTQCFIIDAHPDLCNFCPSQWLDSCTL